MIPPVSIVLLLDAEPDERRWLAAAAKATPAPGKLRRVGEGDRWTVQAATGWAWEVRLERPAGRQVRQALAASPTEGLEAAITGHRVCLSLRLTAAPEGAEHEEWHALRLPGHAGPDCGVDLLGPLRATCALAWPLAAAARVVAFPEGRNAWPVDAQLRKFPAGELGPEHSQLFVSWRPAGVDAAGATWLRTYGLCQAGLPEMSCTVSSMDDPEAMDGADTLFASMAEYLLQLGRALDVGETLELEHRLWEVVDLPAGAPFAAPSHGIRHHVPCSRARVHELRELREKKATKGKATKGKATKRKATKRKATKRKATKRKR